MPPYRDSAANRPKTGSMARGILGVGGLYNPTCPPTTPKRLIAPNPRCTVLRLQSHSSSPVQSCLTLEIQPPCGPLSPRLSSGPLARLPRAVTPNNARTEITRRLLLTLARRWGKKGQSTDVSPIDHIQSCCTSRRLTHFTTATLYVSEPSCKKPKIGVIYLTDAFGIQFVNNKL